MENLTPEQEAKLDETQLEVEQVRDNLAKMAAANARRVRAKEEALEQQLVSDTLNGILAMAERATSLPREELLARAASLEDDEPAPVAKNPRAAQRRRMVEAGVPELYVQNVGDRDPEDCDSLQLAREHYQRRAGGFLVLAGGKGTRKTGSACWMLGEVEGGVFVDASDLLAIAFHDRALYMRIGKARHVVLDELEPRENFTGNDEAHIVRVLTKLWNGWYANDAKVIVTGNFKKPQLLAYGTRIAERMEERGRFFTVGGESVRPSMRKHWLDDKED